ncbi:MAG: ATP-binding protein [Thermoflexales bacterium]|nr:ATP-binding protein [Thermoflexales bacterium]MCS7325205.1 ATP-binding protein [Thermoflexales bacterium]MDW8053369.1 ATP-binding protein [Anaerolineae bacterium]MDW8292022.1 ATP-binding protein [Anaerolineae bacterium]
MPIRLKLTLWYSGVLLLALIVFGIGVYAAVSVLLVRQVDAQLLQAVEAALPLVAGQRLEAVERGGRLVVKFTQLDAFRASEVYVQVISANGEVIGLSPNLFESPLGDAPLDAQSISQHQARLRQHASSAAATELSADIFGDARHGGGMPPLRVLTRPVFTRDNRLIGYLQVATSLESVAIAQQVLLLTLTVSGVLVLMFSSVVGVLLARRALRPVDQITQTAMAIYRAENLDRRVPEPRTNDEVARLSRAFNAMLERLSQLFHAQQRLIADVSHELRTPLTVIRGNVDLLRAMGCTDEESLSAIASEADRMNRMVRDLLLLSQADAGVLSMHFTNVDVPRLIADVERSANMLAQGKLRIVAHAEPNLTLYGDYDRLKQVLLNLVDNAIKHTPEGGEVRIEATAHYNGFARLTVSDTGIGIPEKDLPHIFERFYRVDKSRSRASGGSGLGLSIANTIVQAHHGHIVVNSKVGVGTTFDVYLPMQPPSNGASLTTP